jgi:protein SHQ1
LKPYFLKLTFSQSLLEEGGNNKATYDVDKNELVCTVTKLNPGEHFEDLDMITKLLTPSSLDQDEELKTEGKPLI